MGPVGLRGGLEGPGDGARGARGDLHVGAPGGLEYTERVVDDIVERHVAGHTGHAGQVDVGVCRGVDQREGVVDAGVDVEDHRQALAGAVVGDVADVAEKAHGDSQ